MVERAQAEFFQARVLAVSEATLKVQTSDDGEPVVVARSDAYRVPPSEHRFALGDPAICNEGDVRWVPCRVSRVTPDGVTATLESQEDRAFARGQVIAPTAVTALDVQRRFDVVAAQRRFLDAARGAGEPARPGGWTPALREPVIGRRSTGWFSAHVAGRLDDGGVRVAWDGRERESSLPGAYIVPAPPFVHAFARGEFALLRPPTAGEPWRRVRVDGPGVDEAIVVGEDGQRQHVAARGLVPLTQPFD